MIPKTVLGVDPGYSGAFAIFRDGQLQHVLDMPIVKDNGHTRLDLKAIVIQLSLMLKGEKVKVFIEQVHAMPKQGVVSMFNFGYQVGALHGIIEAFGWEIETILPQSWKRQYGLLGQGKDFSIGVVCKQFPTKQGLFTLKKHHGRAEAALIGFAGITLMKNREALAI